ncbi:MAG: alpha-L-fucosidase [Oscillospiraceae bacterium]|nr:alpha-L-fucosidase [Oscillospiraceae bacterium]
MIVKQYIRDFEQLGFGMFVHFGIYSQQAKGEWLQALHGVPVQTYEQLAQTFDPRPDWAVELAKTAKKAGCKYINITTRHHDGFSLFDTCGLSDYDAPHTACGRDLIREFVDACRAEGLIPFFYHTLMDWHHPDYEQNFPRYLQYLRDSVEILCKNYGKIGGLWFDGMWHKPDADWQEDALYETIRRHQPEAMIINNTGLSALGALGHIELDSVTFERGKPQPLNMEGAPKYVASEMCEITCDHWGYAGEDLNYKSTGQLIRELADCRRYRSNMLMNVGLMGDGSISPIDAQIFGVLGRWVSYFDEAIRKPAPTDIVIEGKPNDFILRDGSTYYLFCYDLPMVADANVAMYTTAEYDSKFRLKDPIRSVTWMDNGEKVEFHQEGEETVVKTVPFIYGRSLVVRVAKIETQEKCCD